MAANFPQGGAKELTARLRSMRAEELDTFKNSSSSALIYTAIEALADIKRRGFTQVEDAPQALADALGTNAYRIAEELAAVLFCEQEGCTGNSDHRTACSELRHEMGLRERLLAKAARQQAARYPATRRDGSVVYVSIPENEKKGGN
jgi:hypothetical protein